MAARVVAISVLLVVLCGCHRKTDEADPGSGSSSTPPAGTPVTPSTRPSFALGALDEMKIAALLSKAGWKTTTVGRAPAGAGTRAYRAVGIKTIGDKRHEAEVLVYCPAAKRMAEGTAYYEDGSCRMQVLVRIGIVAQPRESKSLLKRLLAAHL